MEERTTADIIYALHEEVVNLTERIAASINCVDVLQNKINRVKDLIDKEEDARSAELSAAYRSAEMSEAYISSKDLRKALGYPKKEDEKNDETNS